MFRDAQIPIQPGQAVSRGWTRYVGKPVGVTWNVSATSLEVLRKQVGGRNAELKGKKSWHFGVGRTRAEGLDRYVGIENRSWHTGEDDLQVLRYDGKPARYEGLWWSGARTTIGVNLVLPDDKWTEEQTSMMVELGLYLQKRLPWLKWTDHHLQSDLCPSKTLERRPPLTQILRGLYGEDVPDLSWNYETPQEQQAALKRLGFPVKAHARWTPAGKSALQTFQEKNGLFPTGVWSTFVSQAMDRESK